MAPKPRGGNGFSLDGPDGTEQQTVNGVDGNPDHAGNGAGTVDPTTLAGASGGDSGTGEPIKRGRGRPKGSTAGKQKASAPLDIGSVETLLFNIHAMVAAATGFDKLSINEQEANSLAKAVANVQQYYPMHVSAKAMAWTNLIMVAGSVYGSRAVAIWADQKAKENETRPIHPIVAPENVMPFRQ